MLRKRLISPKGTDLHTEMITLAALGFTAVRNERGGAIEVSDFRDSGIMKVSLQKFFSNLTKQGVVVVVEED